MDQSRNEQKQGVISKATEYWYGLHLNAIFHLGCVRIIG
jgi:hypothetical protein